MLRRSWCPTPLCWSTLNAGSLSKPPSGFRSSSPSPTCFTNANSGSMAGRNRSVWGSASRNWMAMESPMPSAISASGDRFLFRGPGIARACRGRRRSMPRSVVVVGSDVRAPQHRLGRLARRTGKDCRSSTMPATQGGDPQAATRIFHSLTDHCSSRLKVHLKFFET